VRHRVARASLASGLVMGLAMPWTTPALANDDGNVLIGGFEIDGNFYEGFDNSTTDTGPPGDPVDWGSAEIADEVDSVPDVIGGDDESVFDQGAKEDDLETWADSGSAAAPQNGDIGNTWVYDRIDPDTGDQFAYIAFIRSTDTGSVQWYVELNQLPNTTNDNDTAIPDRSVDDLRISIENQGGGDIEVVAIEAWDGDSWEDTGVDVPVAINDSEITIEEQTVDEQLFIELAFNLTDIFGEQEDCTFTGFSTLNVRSQSGLGDQSQLKDYATGEVDIPARCGALTIEKQDPDGALLGGASFTIEPNPIPGAADPGSLDITDNDENDANPTDGVIVIDPAEPGDYTITEVTPPPGYLQTDVPQFVTIEEFGSATVVFENRLGTLTWSKVDDESGDLVCCATFEVTGTAGEADGMSITVVDNGQNDTNPADGVITVEDLVTGTYTVTETVPPDGYDLPDEPTREGIVIDADNPDVTLEVDFSDPRLPSELNVLKLDAETEDPLEGATFALYLDDGDGVPEAPGGDTFVGDCTTGGDGTCTIDGLGWGTYYWFEVEAPTGYELPANRYSDLVLIDRDNAGGEFDAAIFEDPQMRSELEIVKVDATTEDPLGGATFVVRLDDGDGVFETDDDVIVDPPGEVTTDGSGSVTVDDLPFGTYWVEETAAPTGYDLPSPAFQGPFTFDADNGGETITVTFEDPQKLTDLSVLKLDQTSEEPLEGATFELYIDDGDGVPDAPGGDTLIDDCTTGGDGTCTITGLPFGDYYWFETVAPPGYDLPDDPYSVIITINAANAGSEITPISFFDPRRPGTLSVLKVDDTDDALLAGGVFDLVLDDGDGVYEADEDEVVGSCVTNETGTCSVGDLDFGTYFWVETAAPTGYELPDDPVSDPIVIDAGNVDDEPSPVEFRDPRLPSELSVLKLDETDDSTLAGAEFDLVLDDGDGAYEAGEDTVVGSCTTADDGTCSIGDLDFGTYFWVETGAPTGYELPDDPVSDPIVIDASNAGGDISAAVFTDPRILSELSVRKLDETNDSTLAGAEFDLVLDDGDGAYEAGEDTVVGSCPTADDGTCSIGDLDFGTYFWVETAAPTGYELPDDPVSDPITIDAQNAGGEFAVVTFQDPRILSELTVLKLAEDTGDPLVGATFELYLDDGDGVGDAPDEGDVLIDECTTGEDGTCMIGDLDFGDYYWYETAAPDGYVIPDDATSDIITINAENAGTAMEPVTFLDPPGDKPKPPPPPTPKPPSPDLPTTGLSVSPWALGLAAAAMITAGGGLLVAAKRRRFRVPGRH
jgi:uncharacterized surface anchored protein